MIRNIKKAKASTEIITIIENSIRSQSYVDTLKQVSEYYEITYADIIKAFIDSRLPFNDITEDGRKPMNKVTQFTSIQYLI